MRAANWNLLVFGLVALLILAAGIGLFRMGDQLFQAAQGVAPEPLEGEPGDVEGYAFLLQWFGSGFGQLGAFVLQLMALLIAGYGAGLLVLTGLARAVYKATPGRILAYRIVTGVELAFLLLPAPSLLQSAVSAAGSGRSPSGAIAGLALLLLLAGFGGFNAFTRRIEGAQPPAQGPEAG